MRLTHDTGGHGEAEEQVCRVDSASHLPAFTSINFLLHSTMSRLIPKFKSRNSAKTAPLAEPVPAVAYGLEVLAEGADPVVDIVAVHGLNGHRQKTWTASNNIHWLRDLLPNDLPNARIFAWGYDARTHGSSELSCQYLYEHARTLVSELWLERETTQTSRRPIIFIAHSLGGIVVKSALIHSDSARRGALVAHRSIKVSTYGIFFMGTPHQGGNGVALGKLMVNIASVFVNANDRLLQHLERDSESLQQLLGQYGPISGDFVTKFAYEEYPTPTPLGHSMLIVPRASAVVPGAADAEPIAIHANHIDMVRFTSRSDPGYITVSGHIRLMVPNAGATIQQRWEVEDSFNAVPSTQPAVSKPCIIPLYPNKNFVGRDEVLLKLQQKLVVQRQCQRMALVGLGGVGKTQVALQFAWWTKQHRPEHSIFWVPALSIESFSQACERISRELDVTNSTEDEDPKESVKRYLSSTKAGKWLLVIDNADDLDVYDDISKFLPINEDGVMLFTTRHRIAAMAMADTNVLDLEKMSPQEALELLEKSIVGRSFGWDYVTAIAMLEELAFHPLAITQAAAYLKTTQISITEYMQLLRGTEQDLVSLMTREFRDANRYEGSANAVATTWLVSFDKIRATDPAAAELLCFISWIEPRAIPWSLLPDLESNEQKTFAMGTLLSYAFISRRGETNQYDMHRLVHLATKLWIQRDSKTPETSRKATLRIATVFPSNEYTNRARWREYMPHAVRLAQDRETQEMEETYELCYKMGRCLYEDGRSRDSVQWLLKVCRWRETHLPQDDPSLLGSQNQLAEAYLSNGQTLEAIELLEQIVEIWKTLAKEHPNRLASQHELARAYLTNGQTLEAIELLERVVAIRRRTLAENHPARLTSQHELAGAYLTNGQTLEAIELLEYIIAIEKKTLAEEHPARLTSQHELARAYLANGQTLEAIELLEYIVAIEKKRLVEEHPERLTSLYTLARAYDANGQSVKAIPLIERVVAIQKRTLAENHPNRLRSERALRYIIDKHVDP